MKPPASWLSLIFIIAGGVPQLHPPVNKGTTYIISCDCSGGGAARFEWTSVVGMDGWKQHESGAVFPGLQAFCECLRHVIVDFECALCSASATLVFGYFCLLEIEYHHGCVENDSKWDTESNIWLGGSGHSQINHWFGLLLRFGFLDHFLADGKPCCIFPT